MRARLARVVAVAHRDLRIELGGRRGAVLPGALALFLLPLSSAPPLDELPLDFRPRVTGAVPDGVRASPDLLVVDGKATIAIEAPPEGADRPWKVKARSIPDPLRPPLDALETRVKVVNHPARPLDVPQRSLLFALISASVLTGAVAQSLPGERSNRTLETLRTASITPGELVLGKWLAWSLFGAIGGLVASAWSIALGRQELGPWVLAVPWGALVTVAMGLWLVRRADDVVGGATIALRSLPAALTLAGVLAWWLGMTSPWLGALVPIGGALVAAGATWPGTGPVLLACATSALACWALLAATARDLGDEEQAPPDRRWLGALGVALAAMVAWWFPLLAPLLWTLGDAPERTAVIPLATGQVAAVGGLTALAVVLVARDPAPAALGLRRAGLGALGLGVLAGLGLAALGWLPEGLGLGPSGPVVADAVARLRAAGLPSLGGPAVAAAALAAQELLFRGWIANRAGAVASCVAWALVARPADPLVGLVEGAVLAGLATRSGSLAPGLIARAVLLAITWP